MLRYPVLAVICGILIAGFSPYNREYGSETTSGHNDGKTNTSDRNAIEELHQRDMIAGKNLDVNALKSLWTEDAVALPPGEKPIVGKKAIEIWLDGIRSDSEKIKITDYPLNFRELTIVNSWAFEWGASTETIQPLKGGQPKTARAKLLRVLRRQPDGSWKIARSAWNLDAGD
jgi:ketosteroid isomerase-like protein